MEAIKDTWHRLRTVEAAHKLVIIVTDGEWSGLQHDDTGKVTQYQAADFILDMRKEGVHVLGVMLDPYYTKPEMWWTYSESALPRYIEEQQRKSQNILKYMGVDPKLSAIYEDPTDMVEQFRNVAETLMREALSEGVVA